MEKNTKEIQIINHLIQKHIEAIKREDVKRQDKELDYLLIKEAIEALVREYKISSNPRAKKYLMKSMIEANESLFAYLININKYDNKILELYAMLDEFIYS